MRTITKVIVERDWSHAFSRDGFSVGQNFVADRVLSHLGLDEVPYLEPRALTEEEFALLLPRRTKICPYMLATATPRVEPELALPPPPVPPPLEEPPPAWFGRTRSTSRLALPPVTPAVSAAAAEPGGAAGAAASASASAGGASASASAGGAIALRTRSRSHL